MNPRRIDPLRGPLRAAIRAVPSKSETHRALVTAALAHGSSEIRMPLDAEDTHATAAGLRALGVQVHAGPKHWRVEGHGPRFPGGGVLALGDSGTSLRLLLAAATLGLAPSTLDGSARLRQRPLRELIAALREAGGAIRPGSPEGLPCVAGGAPPRGGRLRLDASRSSQFASALLLIGPSLDEGLHLELEGAPVSQPYLGLTVHVLEQFGATVCRPTARSYAVAPQRLEGRAYDVEGDHSAASYFLAAAAVLGGRVRIVGLEPHSTQADARLGTELARAGCAVRRGRDWIEVRGGAALPGFDVDLRDAPDLAPTLAVLALYARGPSTLRGLAHLRHKESDRLTALVENLRAMGRDADAAPDRLDVGPAQSAPRSALIRTCSDHRIAMAFAVAGLRTGVMIDDADCVAKSNPRFWEQLARLRSPVPKLG